MGAHPFPAQDETTALEGLMDRARVAAAARRPWISFAEGFSKTLSKLVVPGNHDRFSGNHWAFYQQVVGREVSHAAYFTQCKTQASNRVTVRAARFLHIADLHFQNSPEADHFRDRPALLDFACNSDRPVNTQLCELATWAIDHAKSLARKRRFRADVVSPRTFLERWMNDVAGKVSDWSFERGKKDKTQSTAEPANEDSFVRQVAMAFGFAAQFAEIVPVRSDGALHLLAACHQDYRAATSSIALVAYSSRTITPTRSVTPRTARPTRRHLCVIRRRSTVDRALRRARMSAAPLAAPAPHAAARASEIRSTSALRGSPRRRLRSPGGAMARAVIAA